MGKDLEVQGANVTKVEDAQKNLTIVPELKAMLQADGGDRGQQVVRADSNFIVTKYADGTTRKDVLAGKV